MTLKRWLYVAGIVVAVTGLAIGAWWIYSLYSRASKWEKLYYDCLSSPADTVVIWKDRVIFSDDTLKPKPRKHWYKTDTVTIHDTIFVKKEAVNYYADSYKKDGVRIRWEAVTKGTLESLQFPNIIIPEKITTVEKKVPVHDTTTLLVELTHAGVYAKLFVNNFSDFPAVEAGALISFRGKGGIMAGGMYNPAERNLYTDPAALTNKFPLYFTIGGFFFIK